MCNMCKNLHHILYFNQICLFISTLSNQMSVHHGRRNRQLLSAEMAFQQLSKQSILKPGATFEITALISLGAMLFGTSVATTGIIYKRNIFIVLGFAEMFVVTLWLIISSYS